AGAVEPDPVGTVSSFSAPANGTPNGALPPIALTSSESPLSGSPIAPAEQPHPPELPPRAGNGFAAAGDGGRIAPGSTQPAQPVPAARPGVPPAPVAANGDQRRTLHLSLGNNSHGNGGGPPAAEPPSVERPS